jgi:hypothetical protein
MATLQKYIGLANRPSEIGVCISADTDDTSMTRNLVQEEILRILKPAAWSRIFFSDNKSKIQAVNANMDEIDYPWDIVVLVSDDMIPQVKGYDDVIRAHMKSRFPDTDGILWPNDGFQGNNLNTLSILGRKMYTSLGCIYRPEYSSLFCDTEFTDLCRGELKDKCLYLPYPIIRHEHPGNGVAPSDELYIANQAHFNTDMYTYISRKKYPSDWSILIATIQGREESLARLLASIEEKKNRICPDIRIEVNLYYDNREMSIGAKRQSLLQGSVSKYSSFVDDDDDVTDAYFEDGAACIRGNYHVARLRGQMAQFTFTHSIENTLDGFMARNGVFVRPPNHLNVILTEVAKFVKFGDAVRGEDLDWTIRLAQYGFLTREYTSDHDRIHYIYNMGTRQVDPRTLEFQATTSYATMLQTIWTSAGAAMPAAAIDAKATGLRLGPKGFVSK